MFDNPKPIKLLKYFFSFATSKSDIILDFFAGSGTTAHAVMAQNALDGGNRKFILCQLDEEIDPKKSKPAYDFCQSNDFDPVISSINERVTVRIKLRQNTQTKKLILGTKSFPIQTSQKLIICKTTIISYHKPTAEVIDTLIICLWQPVKLDTKIETIRCYI